MGIEYSRDQDMIEIIVRDYSGAKIETRTCRLGERKKYRQILEYLKDKYGFEPEVPEPLHVVAQASGV